MNYRLRYRFPRMVLVGTLLMMTFVSTSVLSQDNQAVTTLVEQGLLAQSNNEWTKAKSAWDRVLLSDRLQTDALKGLFYESLQRGSLEEANSYLDKLVKANPDEDSIDIMSGDVKLIQEGMSPLQEARKRIRSGGFDAGIELYRIAFGRVEPNGPLALEFYTTLGGADSGKLEAARGLKRLAEQNLDDWTYELAYSKQLTYSVSDRSEGIQRLIKLMQKPEARSSVTSALKESIGWLSNTHNNIPLYEQYLAVVDDAEIRAILDRLKNSRTPLQERQLQSSFDAMEEDSLERAAQGFKRILRSRPADPEALAGLGIVELRQGNFEQSADFLSRAINSGSENRDWRRALGSARYWSNIETARRLVNDDDFEAALAYLDVALDINPDDEVGLVLKAETLYSLGRIPESESLFLNVIEINPTNPSALRGLGDLYNKTERFEEARNLALTLNNTTEGGNDTVAEGILAQSMVAKARAYMKRNEFDLAQVELENAQRMQSYNPWITLELAQLLIRRQRPDRARLLMAELEASEPLSGSALHALAEFAHLDNRHRDALTFLERIPASERTPHMASTQNRVWMRLQVERSVRLAQNNDFGEARKTLGEAENFAGSQPNMAGALASGWIELGEEERALSIMRTALKLDPDVWLQLQYAGLLLKTRKNRELAQIINALNARSDLDEFQLRELSHIEISLALRQSDTFLRNGQYADSYSAIDPYIELEDEYPNIRMMLGRLYQVTGDLDQALGSYMKIMRDQPSHLDARRSAVGLLIDRKEYSEAQILVDEGMEMFSEHPRMVLLAGQLDAARGKPRKALSRYKNALVLISSDEQTPSFQQANFRIPDESVELALSTDSSSSLDFLDAPEALALESAVGLREDILIEIGRVNAKTSNFLQVGGDIVNRSGEAGLDKLAVFRLPVQFDLGVGDSSRINVEAIAESINADDIQLSDLQSARRFGSLTLDTSLPREEAITASESGLRVGLGFSSRFFSADVGTTPSDYAVSNVYGGLSVTNAGERIKVTGTVSRRTVEDSVLSYAGQIDPFLGRSWGGVTRTGGELRLLVDRQRQGFYGSISGYSLEGENVASNAMSQFGGGVFWRITDTATSELRVGLDLDSFAYDQNLSGYTFGHGGYFSPQNYVNIGVPIQWRGDTGPMQFSLTGKVGFERYEQDDADLFPDDSGLQLQLEELALDSEDSLDTTLRGSRDTGVNISLNGEIVYQLSTSLSLGSTVRVQRSGDYNESRVGLFARYYFSPQEVRAAAPLYGAETEVSSTLGRY